MRARYGIEPRPKSAREQMAAIGQFIPGQQGGIPEHLRQAIQWAEEMKRKIVN